MSAAAPARFDPSEPLGPGRTVIEASAGTGKTFTITAAVTRLVAEEGLALEEILVVTFTRAATAELKDRVRKRMVETLRALEGRPAGPVDDHMRVLLDADAEELRRRADRGSRNLAAAAVLLLALQAWLGKETVERELPAEVVTAHLGVALTLLAVLGTLAAFAFLGPDRRRLGDPARAPFVRLAAGAAGVVLLVLLGGSYLVGSDAGTACTTWPGCQQAPVPFLDGLRAQHVHWAHRLSTLAGFAAVGLVALSATDLRGALAGPLRAASIALLALYGGQMLLGAANAWTQFADPVRAAHLALGAAIWGLAVLIAVAAAYRPGERAGARASAPPPAEREPARA